MDFVDFGALDHVCARGENILNKLGWIPYVGSVSGAFRLAIGKIMFVVGIVLASYYFLRAIITNEPCLNDEPAEYAGYAIHGLANICRALVETMPFYNTVALLVYDAFLGRFCYFSEQLSVGVFPLNPYHPRFESAKKISDRIFLIDL